MTITKSVLIFLLYFIICFSSISRSTSLSSKDLLGISPEDEKYYKTSSGIIKCRDGSKKFTKAQLNDDFCDCVDGTDEPGTSACPNGKFYCRNAGHTPVSLYSSRVNDGICDCCDGSDEYDGKIKCRNSCWEAGKVARNRLMKKIATYQEGVTLRKQEVEKSRLAVAKDEAELSKLQDEEKVLKGLVQQLRERKEQIEKAEEKERLQKEKEEKAKKEAEEANLKESNAEEKADTLEEPMKSSGDDVEPMKSSDDDVEPMKSSDDDVIGLLKDSPPVQDVIEVHEKSVVEAEHSDNSGNEGSPSNEVQQHSAKEEEESLVAHETDLDTGSKGEDAAEDIDSLSREELGRIVGSRWTGKKTEQHSEESDAAKDDDDDHDNYEERQSDGNNEEYSAYDSETEDDRHKYDDDDDDTDDHMEDIAEDDHEDTSSSHNYESDGETDFSDITSTSSQSWLEKIQNTVKKILQSVNLFQTPVDKSEAAHVRKEFDVSMAKLAKMQSRISSLTQKLKHDFGPEKEFYSFYGQCLEIKQNKYVYKICPFKQATQEEGHSTSRLGNWDKFEDSYRIMRFSNGDKCWNGPDRSMKVKLRCGLKNEVTDVGEPSRCEYEALLFTPALCVEEKLKELQDKLDSMNKEQPQGHDEL